MISKLNLICPTYKRSNTLLPQYCKSIIKNTADKKNVFLSFITNILDSDSDCFIHKTFESWEYEIIKESYKKPIIPKYYNMVFKIGKYHNDNTVSVSMLGDDMEFNTLGYDEKIISAMNKYGPEGVFYCSGDNRYDDSLCVNLFMEKNFVKKCSQTFMNEEYPANMIDVIWQCVADSSNMDFYIKNVEIKHNHYSKIGKDDTGRRLHKSRKEGGTSALARIKIDIGQCVYRINRLGYKTCYPIVSKIQRNRPGRTFIDS